VPDGVINFIPGDPQLVTKVVLENPKLSAIHYTGSTDVFRHPTPAHLHVFRFTRRSRSTPTFLPLLIHGHTHHAHRLLWKGLGDNIDRYANYPRLVGETGTLLLLPGTSHTTFP
jgi:1-pyrroline-5-carboxylate dehydrogenase